MRLSFPLAIVFAALMAGCSQAPVRQSRLYGAGEKATAGLLTYNVVDTAIETRLGDAANPRFPQTRFTIVRMAVTNAGNAALPIPGLTLLDDSGKSYPELADGAGVPQWLGIVRSVGAGQTERGSALFDAPAGHYKLRVTDDLSDSDVFIDIPLSFAHEQMNDVK